MQARIQQRTQAAGELALIPTMRTPAAIASAAPLRTIGGGAPADDGFSLTLGQARRHNEILHALRTQRELASSSVPAQAAEHHPMTPPRSARAWQRPTATISDTNNKRRRAEPGYHRAFDPPRSAGQSQPWQQPPRGHPLPGQLPLEEEPGDREPYDDSPTQAIPVVPPAGSAHAVEPAPKSTSSSGPVVIAHAVTVILVAIVSAGLR